MSAEIKPAIKKANQPFLVQQRYKARVAAARADGTPPPSQFWNDVAKFFLVGLMLSMAASKMVSLLYTADHKVTSVVS
jgi:hypothetical protein